MSKTRHPRPPTVATVDRRRSRLTGPLHIQIGEARITLLPGGEVVVTPELRAALGDLVDQLEPIVDGGPRDTPEGGPTEEA